ncbi:hypothetical protein NDR87_30065 [Nocardia sp. CDC159]|uniref:Uncharacterized protein n=1 Tax=Nocardia pulmonis TaxID=2951408 RepID=A0A9X2EEW8_9NOCA|nr:MULTISPECIES: hypothetical protein [Nocardia]MCM6777738.1 hypothetical protein [Nocardia pulmonis]MCM6790623.1 hypothetical protein [Nocardia sp. CDC159]
MNDRHEYAGARQIREGGWIAMCACGRESAGRRKLKNARAEINRHIEKMAAQPLSCPRPGARRFRTQVNAEKSMGAHWQTDRRRRLPVHAEKCRCGYWHLTKNAT